MEQRKEEEVSVYLPFQSVKNCRDLGGITTTDGHVIRNSLLFRSANLHHASDLDLKTLEQMGLKQVVDLRTEWEIAAAPDHLVKDWKYSHLPVIHEEELSRQSGGQIRLLDDLKKSAFELVEHAYPDLVCKKQAIDCWKQFFRILLETDGPVLWHCTQGKDRTGIAAALVLLALGVEEETVEREYLQTNLYMNKELTEDKVIASMLFSHHLQYANDELEGFLCARPEYFQAARKAVFDQYGSWQSYLHEALELSDEDLQALKDKYLLQASSL